MARADAALPAPSPAIAIGARVRVAARYPTSGHVRAPFYLRGKCGAVVRDFGLFYDPTALAAGDRRPAVRRLYQVLFDHAEVWGVTGAEDTRPAAILADIYDNWLETLP